MKKINSIFLILTVILAIGCSVGKKTVCQKIYKNQSIDKIEIFYLALNDAIECQDKLLLLNLLGEDKKKKDIKILYEEFQDIEKLFGFIFHTWLDKENHQIRIKTSDIIDILDFKNLKKLLGKGFKLIDDKDKDFQIYTIPDYNKIKAGDYFIKVKKYKKFLWLDSLLIKQVNKPIIDFKKFHDLFRKSINDNNLKLFESLFKQERLLSFGSFSEHYLTNDQLLKLAKGFELKQLKKTVALGYQIWQKKGRKNLCDEIILPIQPSEENAVFIKRGMEIWVKNCGGLGWEIDSLYQP